MVKANAWDEEQNQGIPVGAENLLKIIPMPKPTPKKKFQNLNFNLEKLLCAGIPKEWVRQEKPKRNI